MTDRMIALAAACFVAALLPTLTACGSDASSIAWSGQVDTLPGGALHVRNPGEGLWTEEGRWRLVEDLRIGALESGGPDQFGQVTALATDDAGRIYVLEGQANDVRVFDAAGVHVRTLGRPGGGPGELGQPVGIALGPGATVWVVDFGNRRYEVFDTAGSRVTSYPFPGTTMGFGNTIGSDGLLYEQFVVPGPSRSTIVRRRIPEAVGEDIEVVDTLLLPERAEPGETVSMTLSQGAANFTIQMPVPLTPRSIQELVHGEGWWVTGASADYRLVRTTFDGDTVMVVERAYDPVPVTEEARRAAIENLPGEADLPPDRIPDRHPPFTSLEQARDGALWIRRQTGPETIGYDVFSSEGRYLGEVATDLPLDRFRLMEIRDDAVYGVLRDELDVPYVVRLRIERP